MNNLTNIVSKAFEPKAALIVYVSNEGVDKFIELLPIDDKGNFGASAPISYEFMTSLCQSFSEAYSKTPSGQVPNNMLYCDTRAGVENYVWYNLPQKRKMFFKKDLNIKNDEYHVPGVIYVVNGEKLDIYAYKGNKLSLKTKLFKAPFFNVTGESVCLGNPNLSLRKNPSFQDLIEYWEKLFWLTEFSHLGGSKNPTKDNLTNVTLQSQNKPFEESQLLPFPNLTLEKLLNNIKK